MGDAARDRGVGAMTSKTPPARAGTAMTMGLVGLGRMGAGIHDRLRQHGHTVTGYDRDPELADVGSLEDLVRALPPPRVLWVMVPSAAPPAGRAPRRA
ncbi:MAG: hypothetical protein FJZ92_12360, partial [Chloroflexi bacterium]|nr:hypothetical protein [Chloroflexota bacterium]